MVDSKENYKFCLGVEGLIYELSPRIMLESMSIYEQLCSYPSPYLTLTLTCYQFTAVVLGEGWVCS